MVFTKKQLNNFFQKVEKTSSCWNWKGYTANGYGKVNINAKVYFAHKISLIISGSKISPSKNEKGSSGMVVMHICDNRKCVKPSHLEIATQKENMADAKLKNRKWNGRLSGEKNSNSKLSISDVSFIRNSKMKKIELSKLFNIDRSQIYRIINNNSWVTA